MSDDHLCKEDILLVIFMCIEQAFKPSVSFTHIYVMVINTLHQPEKCHISETTVLGHFSFRQLESIRAEHSLEVIRVSF